MSRRTRLVVLVAIAVLVSTACGGADDDDGGVPAAEADVPAEFTFRPSSCPSAVATFQCLGRQADGWLSAVDDPDEVLAGVREAIRNGTFGIDIETTDDPEEYVDCLESRSARSVCNYLLASSVPCFGPPGGAADLIGLFSTEAGLAWRVADEDYASAVIDLVCEARRKVNNDTHDDFGDGVDSDRGTRRINELSEHPDARRWLATNEGRRFVEQLNDLATIDAPVVRSLPRRWCGVKWFRAPC